MGWTNLEAQPPPKYFHFTDAVCQDACSGHGLQGGGFCLLHAEGMRH